MYIKKIICLAAVAAAFSAQAQNIGIGTNTPNASALLDISSTSKGLLIPRMSNTQMNAISSPAPGLLVFNLTDSLLYVRKNSGWTKLVPTASSGSNWIASGNDIYNSNNGNVGIGSTSPTHARLEINNSVGAAVAMFGADKTGITIAADNPGIGFNYYYDGASARTIKQGYAALMEMDKNSGDIYIGNFNNNQSAADFATINGYQTSLLIKQDGNIRMGDVSGTDGVSKLAIKNKSANSIGISLYNNNDANYGTMREKDGNFIISTQYKPSFLGVNHLLLNPPNPDNVPANTTGNVGINTNDPVHAKLELNGRVGATVGMFGADKFGTTINADNPGVGLNYYFDGTNARTIKQGYAGLLEMDRFNGNIYIGNFGGSLSSTDFGTINNYQTRLLIKQNGNTGIGTTDPTERLHVNGNLRVNNDVKIDYGGVYAAETGNLNIVPMGIVSFNYTVNNNGSLTLNNFTNDAGSIATTIQATASIGGVGNDVVNVYINLDYAKFSSYTKVILTGTPQVGGASGLDVLVASIDTDGSSYARIWSTVAASSLHPDNSSSNVKASFILYGVK